MAECWRWPLILTGAKQQWLNGVTTTLVDLPQRNNMRQVFF
ncbi:hypothetical protein [Enterobacter asburiae]|nr:hypothetical protein [Enterobacter asburiae]